MVHEAGQRFDLCRGWQEFGALGDRAISHSALPAQSGTWSIEQCPALAVPVKREGPRALSENLFRLLRAVG